MNMKNVVNYRINSIKTKEDLNAVVSLKPTRNRNKILRFFKSAEPGAVGFFALKDPVTKKAYSTGNICYEKDGYRWTNAVVYLFEKYNIKLNEDFIKKFD